MAVSTFRFISRIGKQQFSSYPSPRIARPWNTHLPNAVFPELGFGLGKIPDLARQSASRYRPRVSLQLGDLWRGLAIQWESPDSSRSSSSHLRYYRSIVDFSWTGSLLITLVGVEVIVDCFVCGVGITGVQMVELKSW
jgi:hypothetical protein